MSLSWPHLNPLIWKLEGSIEGDKMGVSSDRSGSERDMPTDPGDVKLIKNPTLDLALYPDSRFHEIIQDLSGWDRHGWDS